jgi:hypothetical protein
VQQAAVQRQHDLSELRAQCAEAAVHAAAAGLRATRMGHTHNTVIGGKDLIIIYVTAFLTLTASTVDLPLTVDRKK